MIDHVSVGVVDLHKAADFYRAVFAPLGVSQVIAKPGSIGFGKKYPEFWINERSGLAIPGNDNGTHVCLRAASKEIVIEFYTIAIEHGATSSGEPGYREDYRAPDYRDATHPGYYAAFIRDPYQNHVEVVTFVTQ